MFLFCCQFTCSFVIGWICHLTILFHLHCWSFQGDFELLELCLLFKLSAQLLAGIIMNLFFLNLSQSVHSIRKVETRGSCPGYIVFPARWGCRHCWCYCSVIGRFHIRKEEKVRIPWNAGGNDQGCFLIGFLKKKWKAFHFCVMNYLNPPSIYIVSIQNGFLLSFSF